MIISDVGAVPLGVAAAGAAAAWQVPVWGRAGAVIGSSLAIIEMNTMIYYQS